MVPQYFLVWEQVSSLLEVSDTENNGTTIPRKVGLCLRKAQRKIPGNLICSIIALRALSLACVTVCLCCVKLVPFLYCFTKRTPNYLASTVRRVTVSYIIERLCSSGASSYNYMIICSVAARVFHRPVWTRVY